MVNTMLLFANISKNITKENIAKMLRNAREQVFFFIAYRYVAVMPPSTTTSEPVMKLEASEARNRMALAMSMG